MTKEIIDEVAFVFKDESTCLQFNVRQAYFIEVPFDEDLNKCDYY